MNKCILLREFSSVSGMKNVFLVQSANQKIVYHTT